MRRTRKMNEMDEDDGMALTDVICEIIHDEMHKSGNDTWDFDVVAKRLVDQIGQEAADKLDIMQAITDAMMGEPVGSNVDPSETGDEEEIEDTEAIQIEVMIRRLHEAPSDFGTVIEYLAAEGDVKGVEEMAKLANEIMRVVENAVHYSSYGDGKKSA
jgi:hypothetical protein